MENNSFLQFENENSSTFMMMKPFFRVEESNRIPFTCLINEDKQFKQKESLISNHEKNINEKDEKIIKNFWMFFDPYCTKAMNKLFIFQAYKEVKYALKCLRENESVIEKINMNFDITKKILVLDLEGTLLYCDVKEDSIEILFRPGIYSFLQKVSEMYEICIFSEASEMFVTKIIERLNENIYSQNEENKTKLHKFLSKKHCVETKKGRIIKDLRVMEDIDLRNIIIIDDRIEAFALQLENGIPILPFMGEKNDKELFRIEKILEKISIVCDVREEISKVVNIKKIIEISKQSAVKLKINDQESNESL